MRIFKLGLGAALLMAIVAAGFAHADVNLSGTTAAGFLTNGGGPRVLSMGGATLALGGDLQQEWLGMGGRFGHSSTRWSVSGLYQGDGSIEGRDASNNPTGSFNASSFAVGAQLAQRFGDHAAIGVGAKLVDEKLADVTGMGMTFDFGGQIHAGGFGLGASATNVGGQMRYSDAVYAFPTSYGGGVSYSLPSGLSVAMDADFPKSYYGDVRFGAEWRIKDMLALRGGYRHEMSSNGVDDGLSGPTFGIGAGYQGLWFDYGYLISGVTGGSEQRLAISFHPGGFGLRGAALGDRGTGASHAPMANATPKPATTTAPAATAASAKPRTKTGSDAGDAPLASTPATPIARGASMTPVATSDAGPAPKTVATPSPTSAPAVVSKSTAAASTHSATADPADAKPAQAAAPTAPTPAPKTTVAESIPARPRPSSVTVKAGDTLASIARRFDTSVPAIMMQNDMVSEKIKVGQKLKLPNMP